MSETSTVSRRSRRTETDLKFFNYTVDNFEVFNEVFVF